MARTFVLATSKRHPAGLRIDLTKSRLKVTGCDAGTEVSSTGLKTGVGRKVLAGAYGSQAPARSVRRQRSRG